MASHAFTAPKRQIPLPLRLSSRKWRAPSFSRTASPARAQMLPGKPASAHWCRTYLAGLRGEKELTLLPVGVGLDALRYGLSKLHESKACGLAPAMPLAFVIEQALRVERGEVCFYVPVKTGITFH